MTERRCAHCGTPLTFHTYDAETAEFVGVTVSWVDDQTRRTGDDGHRHVPRIDWKKLREDHESREEFLRMVERNRRASVPGWIYR